MRGFWEMLIKILKTIAAVPLCIIMSILLMPIYFILWIIALIEASIDDIWKVRL